MKAVLKGDFILYVPGHKKKKNQRNHKYIMIYFNVLEKQIQSNLKSVGKGKELIRAETDSNEMEIKIVLKSMKEREKLVY